jgi:hypothetical protein
MGLTGKLKEGDWVVHARLRIEVEKENLRNPPGFELLRDFHVSLGPKFCLRHFQLQGFLEEIRGLAGKLRRRVLYFEGAKLLKSANGEVVFYSLLAKFDSGMETLLRVANDVFERFSPKVLEKFDVPIVHMSIAQAPSPVSLAESWLHHPRVIGVQTAIECTIGGTLTSIPLR